MDIPFQSGDGSRRSSSFHHHNSQQGHQYQIPPPNNNTGRLGFGRPNTLFGSGIQPVFSSPHSGLGNAGGNLYNYSGTSSRTNRPSPNGHTGFLGPPRQSSTNYNTRGGRPRGGYNGAEFQNTNKPSFQESQLTQKSVSSNPQNNGHGIGYSSSIDPPVGSSMTNASGSSTVQNASDISIQGNPGAGEPKQDDTEPQYRIFKRGDSMQGMASSPDRQIQSEESTPLTPNLNASVDKENMGTGATAITGNSSGSRILTAGIQKTGSRTTVSLIGEIAKFHGLGVEYHLVKEIGPPHAPTFTVILKLGTEEYEGMGASIKKAQVAAATDALNKTSFSRPPPRGQPKRNYAPHHQTKGTNWPLLQLTALAESMKEPLSFVNQPVTILDPFHKGEPPSRVDVHVGDRIFTGEGPGYNTAKNMATMIALKALIQVKQEQELTRRTAEGSTQPEALEDENKSPISVVHEMAMKRSLRVGFNVTKEAGPPHMKVFTVQCTVGDLRTEADGQTKQQAKKSASEEMIVKLREIPLSIPNATSAVNSIKSIQRGLFKTKVNKRKTSTPVVKDLENQVVSPISRLIQIAHIKKYKEPEFSVLQALGVEAEFPTSDAGNGRPNNRRNTKRKPLFVIEVKVGPHVAKGEGVNKKAAKKVAADNALTLLGYPPSDTGKAPTAKSQTPALSPSSTNTQEKLQNDLNIVSARQIVPGLLAVSSAEIGNSGSTVETAVVAEEMVKVNSLPIVGVSAHEGVNKLSYLSHLLEVGVSYSDFPRKNEFLCVVSLGTNPPHVVHGIGSSLENARNTAALQMLDELSKIGLDNVSKKAESPKKEARVDPSTEV